MPDHPTKLCECGCGEPAPLAEKAYIARGLKMGDPLRFVDGHQNRRPFSWTEEDRGYESPCHIWAGNLDPRGYGVVWRYLARRYGERRAHRAAWVMANGPIPEGMVICHRCDVPSCVNPEHLFVGTQADNVADMMRKGRGHKATGEDVSLSRLTTGQVEYIRRVKGKIPTREIAGVAGVTVSTIAKIWRGEAWKHL